MIHKRIITIFTTVLFLCVSAKETNAQYHNKATNESQRVRDIQLLLSLYGFSGDLDGRCGRKTKEAIEERVGTVVQTAAGTACSVLVLNTLINKIHSVIETDKPPGVTPLTTADIQSLSAKLGDIEAITIDSNNKLERITKELEYINIGVITNRANEYSIKPIIWMSAFVIVMAITVFLYFRKSDIYWFGAPVRKEHRERLIADLNERFHCDPEGGVTYINNITDRLISKAVGLLQYNAVLLAVTYIISYNVINCIEYISTIMLYTSISFSIISALFMMLIMFTHWHKDYKKTEQDLKESAYLCMDRSILMTGGLLLGFSAAVLDIVFFTVNNGKHADCILQRLQS